MKQIIFIILGVLISSQVFAQLVVKPIPKIAPYLDHEQARLSMAPVVADTVTLPFWDDFSYNGQNPDSIYWLVGNDVLINSGGGINPPSLNVATFDGIDANGQPHSSSDFVSPADVLESQPINLSLVPEIKRPTVWLSFFWQMKGLGELPDESDSIRLQFLNADDQWVSQWVIAGLEENDTGDFQKQYVAITDPSFYHPGFKFKFQNFGKTTGPFDVWHLDYIYLNQDRVSTNESIFDLAIATEPPSLFNTYSNIPYDQLFAFPDTIFAPYSVGISSQENDLQPVTYDYLLSDAISNQIIIKIDSGTSSAINALDRSIITPPIRIDRSLLNPNTDSLILLSNFLYKSGDEYLISSIDDMGVKSFLVSDSLNYRINDSLDRTYIIHETLSYDDGSADFAAGVNQKFGQIAVEYTIAVEDTLTAMDIYFPRIGENSNGESITLSVIKGDLVNNNITQLYRNENELVKIDSLVNLFVRYELSTPLIVSGTFYLVFEQITDNFIGIGLDKNNPQPNKIFSNTEGDWLQNNAAGVDGSLMFRAIFGNSKDIITSTKLDKKLQSVTIYPNPAQNRITLEGNFESLEMYAISGEKIHIDLNKNEIDVSNLKNGIYLLKILNSSGLQSQKIIISK